MRASYRLKEEEDKGFLFRNLKAYKTPDEVTFSSCGSAMKSIIYWVVVFYGDFYGNLGENTLVSYMYQFAFIRVPALINVCLC